MTYLSYRDFESGFCDSNKKLVARLHSYPLYDYAVINRGMHASDVCTPSEGKNIILSFLASEKRRDAMSQGMLISRERGIVRLVKMGLIMGTGIHSGWSQDPPRSWTALHFAAYFGLIPIITKLLNEGHDPNAQDTWNTRPLAYAAVMRQHEAVKLLLDFPRS
jgi:hypothetical protein